jgi:hypothetical protein
MHGRFCTPITTPLGREEIRRPLFMPAISVLASELFREITFYQSTQYYFRAVFIQFPTDGSPPNVHMKRLETEDMVARKESIKDEEDVDMSNDNYGDADMKRKKNEFHKFNYDRLFESETSFMRKMDHLLAVFRN